MSKTRRKKIAYMHKKAYENQSVFIDNVECDLSLIWSSVEMAPHSKISIESILKNISDYDFNIVKKAINNKRVILYPLLMYKSQVLDGHEVLASKIKNKKNNIDVVFAKEKDILDSIMD